MTFRDKLSSLFGFRLTDEESVDSYLKRMDKAGQIDTLKLVKLITVCLEEIESLKKSSKV